MPDIYSWSDSKAFRRNFNLIAYYEVQVTYFDHQDNEASLRLAMQIRFHAVMKARAQSVLLTVSSLY